MTTISYILQQILGISPLSCWRPRPAPPTKAIVCSQEHRSSMLNRTAKKTNSNHSVWQNEEPMDWIEQGLTSHSTHFRSLRRRWGDCGISQDCSRSQSPQCVRLWVVCARPLLITVVCMCIIWKALCPVCFRCPARTVGFSGTRRYLCIYNQPSWATLKRYPPPG